MRVLVCGGRDFNDYVYVYDVLSDLHDETPVTHVIVGGASGADYWGEAWAYNTRIPFTVFKPEWKKHGKAAGPIRNDKMIKEGRPDIVIAFPGGRGTADMVSRAKAASIPVREIT